MALKASERASTKDGDWERNKKMQVKAEKKRKERESRGT